VHSHPISTSTKTRNKPFIKFHVVIPFSLPSQCSDPSEIALLINWRIKKNFLNKNEKRLQGNCLENFEILSSSTISLLYIIFLHCLSLRKSFFTIMRKYACRIDIASDRKIEAINNMQLTKAFFDVAEFIIARIGACLPKRKRTTERVFLRRNKHI